MLRSRAAYVKLRNMLCRAKSSLFASSSVSVMPLPHFSRPGDQLRISYFGFAPFQDMRLISFV